jgi:hypothetical protein
VLGLELPELLQVEFSIKLLRRKSMDNSSSVVRYCLQVGLKLAVWSRRKLYIRVRLALNCLPK